MSDFNTDFNAYNRLALSKTNDNFATNLQGSYTTSPVTQNSIFSQPTNIQNTSNSADELKAQLQSVKDEQGIIGKAWNGIKNFFGIGLSSKDVEESIQKYENGQMTYEEVEEEIQKFDQKQSGMTDIVTNVASGLIVAGTAVATGGLSLGVVATGAAVGGAAKAGIKTLDRATNNVEGDALDAKQIVKDGLTGAIDGAVTVATAGMVKPLSGAAGSVKEAVKQGAIQGAKAGAISGAAIGAGNYAVEAAFEDDVDFTMDGLLGATAQSALVGGVVGGIAGGVTNGLKQTKINQADAQIQAEAQARTQAEAQAKLKAEEAQEYYRQLHEGNLSGESAEDAAKAFEQQFRVEDAIDDMNNGTSYSEARETATKNLTHDEKKYVKQQLSEVRSEQIKAEKAVEVERATDIRTTQTAKADVHEAGFGMQNLTDADEVTARIESAKASAQKAQEAADDAKRLAGTDRKKMTRKQAKAARITQNKATQAQLEAEHIEQAGQAQIQKIEAQAARKAENVAAQQSSPNYETGQAKMEANAQKAQARSAARAKAKTVADPRVQGKMQAFMKQRKTIPALQKILANPNTGNIEKQAAELLIQQLQAAAV